MPDVPAPVPGPNPVSPGHAMMRSGRSSCKLYLHRPSLAQATRGVQAAAQCFPHRLLPAASVCALAYFYSHFIAYVRAFTGLAILHALQTLSMTKYRETVFLQTLHRTNVGCVRGKCLIASHLISRSISSNAR